MKVHVYGNVLNLGYITTKMLKNKGVDAILFLDDSSVAQQDYPWWDDSSLNENNLPKWVKYYKTFPFFLFPNKNTKRMIQDFSECDVAFVSCFGPILAMKAKVPFIFVSAGSDLNMIDIKTDLKRVFFSSLSFKGRLKKLFKIITYTPLQKKALIKYSNRILVLMGYQYRTYIEGYGLENKTERLNLPKDIKSFGTELDEELYRKYRKYKVVFFMLSRHCWQSIWNNGKGNNKFLKAYSRFIKDINPNVLLITANKGIDIQFSKVIVKEEGIEDYIEWVNDMPKYELKKYQSLPNVVMVDNFSHNDYFKLYPADKEYGLKVGFGFGSVESLAAKRPLLTAFRDLEFYDNEIPPIFEAYTEDEIYHRLYEIYAMSLEELVQKGEEGYRFVMKWYDNDSLNNKIPQVIEEVYQEVLNENTKK